MADLIERESVIKAIAERQDKATTGTEECALYTAIKIVRDAPAFNRWIPCSESLPEKHTEVLAYSPFWGKIVVALWGGEYWLEQWTDDDLQSSEITHWMPLPEPPEQDGDSP